MVECLQTVSPKESERYILRTLLLQVTGLTSFEDNIAVDGKVCTTNCEICLRQGLWMDNAEWKRSLRDEIESFFQLLTEFFAMILAHFKPANPILIFADFKDTFINDNRNRFRSQSLLAETAMALQYVLVEIQKPLSTISKCSMSQIGFETLQNNVHLLATIQQQLTPDYLRQLANVSIQQFNIGQRQVFNKVISTVLPEVSIGNLDQNATEKHIYLEQFFFLDAPGGNGKTFVTSAIQRFLQSKGKCALTIVSSTVEAQPLDGDQTAHPALKISIPANSESTCNIKAESQLSHELCKTHLIIWDEIFMTLRHNLEAVDPTLLGLRRSTLPFGGIFRLCLGYFRHILPVV